MKIKHVKTGNVTSQGKTELRLAFCATGSGGEVDPSCGKSGEAHDASKAAMSASTEAAPRGMYGARDKGVKLASNALRDAGYAASSVISSPLGAQKLHDAAARYHEKAARFHENVAGGSGGRHHSNAANLHREAAKLHRAAATGFKLKLK